MIASAWVQAVENLLAPMPLVRADCLAIVAQKGGYLKDLRGVSLKELQEQAKIMFPEA